MGDGGVGDGGVDWWKDWSEEEFGGLWGVISWRTDIYLYMGKNEKIMKLGVLKNKYMIKLKKIIW